MSAVFRFWGFYYRRREKGRGLHRKRVLTPLLLRLTYANETGRSCSFWCKHASHRPTINDLRFPCHTGVLVSYRKQALFQIDRGQCMTTFYLAFTSGSPWPCGGPSFPAMNSAPWYRRHSSGPAPGSGMGGSGTSWSGGGEVFCSVISAPRCRGRGGSSPPGRP